MSLYTLPDYFMISPEFRDEVLGKQGEIGLLITGYEYEDSFFLRFEDGQLGAYSADAILTLKPSHDILNYLEEHSMELQKADFRKLHSIAILLEYGTVEAQKKALILTQGNRPVLEGATAKLSDLLDISHSRRIGW
jgi:hypothetical protein